MNTRAEVLALSVVLESNEETTLGPTDSRLCAEALRHYSRLQLKQSLARSARLPALIAAAIFGAVVAAVFDFNLPLAELRQASSLITSQ